MSTSSDRLPRALLRLLPLEGSVVLLLCLLAACALTMPLVLAPDSTMLAGKFHWSHAWAMELVHMGLEDSRYLELRDLADTPPGRELVTPMLEFPRGGAMVFLGWFNLAVGVGLRRLLGVVASFNASVLLVLAMAPWAAWLLARRLGAGRPGAVLAALVFGFNPYLLGVIGNGQMAKYNHAWIALLALCAWGMGRHRQLRWVPLCWLLAFACFASSPYNFIFAALTTSAFAVAGLWVQRGWKARLHAGGLLLAGAVGAGLACARLLPVYGSRNLSLLSPSRLGPGGSHELAATLPAMLWPGELGFRATWLQQGTLIADEHHVAYLGVSTLLLAAAATWALRRRALPLLALAGGFALLALGRFGHFPGSDKGLPLPLALVDSLPEASAVVFSYRFVVVVFLALGLLLALGAGPLLARLPSRWRGWAIAGAAGLLLVDFALLSPAPFPLETERVQQHRVYAELPPSSDLYGIVELPCDLGFLDHMDPAWPAGFQELNQRQIFQQAFHRKGLAMVDKGNHMREAYRTDLLIKAIDIIQGRSTTTPASTDASMRWYASNRYRYLVVHEHALPPAAVEPLSTWLEAALGPPERYPGEGTARYAFPEVPQAAAPRPPPVQAPAEEGP
jgi:hypothetical protein